MLALYEEQEREIKMLREQKDSELEAAKMENKKLKKQLKKSSQKGSSKRKVVIGLND